MRLRRIPALYWILSAGLVACTGLTVLKLTGAARDAVAHWGELAESAVAVGPMVPGDVVQIEDVEFRSVPVALLPDSPLVHDPVGLVVVTPLVAGDIFVEARLGPTGITGPAALLASGERAVTLPRDAGTPPVRVGDRVDLVATAPTGASPFGGTEVLASGALVIDESEESVTVALPASRAPTVASASVQGLLAVLLSSPGETSGPAETSRPGETSGSAETSGPGGRQGENRSADDDAVDDERRKASPAHETEQAPYGGEAGDPGGGHADSEGGQEAGRDSPTP